MKRSVLAFDLGGSALKWGIVGEEGRLLRLEKETIEDRSPEGVVRKIGSLIKNVGGQHPGEIAAVGIGTPGLLDAGRRMIRTSPNFPLWRDFPLPLKLEHYASGLPLAIENDANLLVFSETRWGNARGVENLVALTLGTGVGGGVLVEGRLLRGKGGGAGELGHIPVDPNGPPCGCGSTGCLETYCSIGGVMRTAEEVYTDRQSPENPETLVQAALDGDSLAVETWRRVGRALGIGIAALVNVFNPEKVLIGGGLAGAGELLLEPARETAAGRCYPQNWSEVTVEQAGLGEASGLLGAAVLAWKCADGALQK